MHLSPREIEKLLLHNAGFLAQKRLARGLRLNHPEAVALIATQLLEFIREGKTRRRIDGSRRKFLGRNQVMPGVPEMIADVQVEGTFPTARSWSQSIIPSPAKAGILNSPFMAASSRSPRETVSADG